MTFTSKTAALAGAKGTRKGVPNKINEKIRVTLEEFVHSNTANFQGWIEKIAEGDPENGIDPDPAKAIDAVTKLIEYVLPKKEKIEVQFGAGPIDMSKWK